MAASSIGSTFPFFAPDEWEFVIGTIRLPFRTVQVVVDGFKAGMKLDVKEAPGEVGASITYQGYKLARGTITMEVSDQAGWDLMLAVIQLVRPRAKLKAPNPFEVSYPGLAALDINKILVTDIGIPKPLRRGVVSCSMDAIEFAPPPATKKPATKALVAADVPDALSSKTAPPVFGPPRPPSATKPKP